MAQENNEIKEYIYDIESDRLETSYCTYDVSLSTVNFDLSNINEITNSKSALDDNLLVVAMLDDKMYYDRNVNKSSYQYNSLLFINHEKDIIPLSLNIKDINSPLTIINSEIQTKIDNNTIIDKEKELTSDYNVFNVSDNNKPGIFKVDNDSLIINDDKVTLSYNIADIIDNIDDHINIMDNVITQCSYNLNNIMVKFKEYPLYDKRYACNIDTSADLYYSDEKTNNDIMKIVDNKHYHHIDYYQHYFKIKIKFTYNYLSGNIGDFNPFNEDNLEVIITDLINDDQININDFIKFNKNKSYIFNSNTISYDEYNVIGEVNYICYFNIFNDELYNLLSNLNNIPNHLSFTIDFKYNDPTINIDTYLQTKLDMFIDKLYKKDKIHNILYHDYSVGFNYDKIGSIVGICMIQNCSQYENKPIFMKYFKNDNNYIVNRISNDLLKNDKISEIVSNGEYSNQNYNPDDEQNNNSDTLIIYSKQLRNSDDNYINELITYKETDILDDSDMFYNMNSKYINKLYDTKLIYRDYLKYAFNNTYNISGNGLRKGDCYVPCLSELALFFEYGFNYYINKSNNIKKFDSSTLYIDNTGLVYIYTLDYSSTETMSANISKELVGKLTVDEYGQLHESNGMTTHKSISLFKIPDYSILSGQNYYLEYNEDDNCELISYSTKTSIKINVKSYNNLRNIINSDFIFKYDENSLTITKPTLNKISDNIYQICFDLKKFDKQYYNIDIYFKDYDDGMNDEEIYVNGNTSNYRKLCKLSIKIE